MARNILLLLSLSLLVISCDPCTNCGPLVYDPTVKLIFVDAEIFDDVVKKTTATDVSIFWEEAASIISFDDGEKNFITPLSNEIDGSSYSITISGNMHDLELSYELYREFDIDHRMVVRAMAIESVSHSFDSLVFSCGINGCLDKETTITCYF